MTTETRCRWVASDKPRVLSGRHQDECRDDECRGCLPCPMTHCRCCSLVHVEGTCGECLAEVRDNLQEIGTSVEEVPEELEVKGVRPELLSLVGPVADPEARGHLRASVAAGRLAKDAEGHVPRDKHGNELPDLTPLWVTGSWAMVYREAFGHPEPADLATLDSELNYFDRHLTEMAVEEWVPFEDFARDVRACLGNLKAVLHDQDRGERANADCFRCGNSLERKLTASGFEDQYTCRKCGQRYTVAEYNFALRAVLEKQAAKTETLEESA